jgi:hypothetical protein
MHFNPPLSGEMEGAVAFYPPPPAGGGDGGGLYSTPSLIFDPGLFKIFVSSLLS